MERCFHATLAALVALAAAGCVIEKVETERETFKLFEFPDIDHSSIDFGTYHGVSIWLELNPQVDLKDDQFLAYIAEWESASELYRLGDLYTITYAHGMFEAGGARYPARQGSRLYLFKPRQRPFPFSFRGQPIIVEGAGVWSPAIYFQVEKGSGPAGIWQAETLRIGSSTLRADSRERHWLLNDRPFEPNPSRPLRLKGAHLAAG
jgi:hypothetical protein